MRYLLLIITLLLVACSSTLPTVSPYKMEITLGNIVTSKMLAQLKPGMSKSQVKFIVGTPLIQDMFHKDRWDYYLQQIIDGKITEQRRVIIDFKDDKLINVSGDVIPIEKGDIADASAGYKFTKEDPQVIAKTQTAAAISKPDESSWSDYLMFWKENKTDADKAALKKQIEAHNQSLLDLQAESRVAAENSKSPNIALPAETAAPSLTTADNNVDTKTMGKAPEQVTKKEERGFWSKLKFWDAAAPIATAPIAGSSSVTPPLNPVPVVTVTSAVKPGEPDNTVVVTSKPTEIKPLIKAAEAPTLPVPAVAPVVIESSALSPAPAEVAEPLMSPSAEVNNNMPAESTQKELLHLSENLETHLDMPLSSPFSTTEPVPLGLRLTSMIALANEAIIEKANIEINMKADEAAKATEKAKEQPSFFERMLERVGF